MLIPDRTGHFGEFGGKYVPETLMALLEDLENIFKSLRSDSKFRREFAFYLKEYAGRPTNLYHAERVSAHLKTLKVYLKREDFLPLLEEDNLPIVDPDSGNLTIVVRVEKELARAFVSLTQQVGQEVIAIDVDMEVLVAGLIALE